MTHALPHASAAAHDRRAGRIAVDIPVTITSVLSSPAEASLANLTEQGALIIGTTLPKGSPFQIEYAGQVVYATVMWAEEDRFGARFPLELHDGPLHDRLAQARAEQQAPAAAPPRRREAGIPSPLARPLRPAGGFGRRGIG
ncbi:hypothetical protein GGR43_001932 [Sphingobium jiangsuense]|uniref:PilZ domain-containing protein n=1 Tax=Sphingobium jiangsuense TaxID=870476 RepID=A0A7W6BLX1_9SPHN|nr:PilZ domain-containing protein [Sphingobium jiangsuense]MBB3926215.1 hypothetical protein [Sphingobium jiangsuense]